MIPIFAPFSLIPPPQGPLPPSFKKRFTIPASEPTIFPTRRLPPPKTTLQSSFQPPRYFFRGIYEKAPQKEPEPIWYLITESLESPTIRPVPHNSTLLKSLCKGTGRLRQSPQGFFYLDIDNQFITALLPYLRFQGLIRPPYFNLFHLLGAHIPILSSREAKFHYLEGLKELGQEYDFEVEGLYSLEPDNWPEVEEVWFFNVRSPALEALRRRYFLTALPSGHPFPIAIAIHPRAEAKKEAPLMRINPAFLVA
ncbi:MAG: hypothetical protein KGJ02_03690 [Verrucomicrobiota bacterium]|nr:hypothetical protein [Verrucomicrobiota bacterium]